MAFLGKNPWEAGMSFFQQMFIIYLKALGIVLNVEIYIYRILPDFKNLEIYYLYILPEVKLLKK